MATKIDTGKQLPLKEEEGSGVKKGRGKTKEEKKRNKVMERWVIFGVLIVTILISLGFYLFSSVEKKSKQKEDIRREEGVEYLGGGEDESKKDEGGLFGSAVHEL